MQLKKTMLVSLILNSITAIFEIAALIIMFIGFGDEQHAASSFHMFQFFTNDSNILLLLAALFLIYFEVKSLITKTDSIPNWVYVFKLLASVGTTLTFLTVMFYLLPVVGVGMIGTFGMASLHIVCPLAAMISFIFFENGEKIVFKSVFLGIVPAAIYALIIVPLVAAKLIESPYPFTDVINNPAYISVIAAFAIIIVTFLCSLGLWKLNQLFYKKVTLKLD
ncbi:MAG: hypothetical protein LKJ88_00340 [Bacilli bacterium]|jgi:hypothetical protein|nr:hypothetical protein [Bacilli bacterium]